MDIIRELEHIKADIRDLNHSLEIPTGSGSVHDRLHDIESALDHETAEMDTSLVLSPDGAGGVAWGAAGAGDMLKSVYDTDDDGVVDNSEAVGGASLTDIQDEIDGDITAHAGDADAHHDRLHDVEDALDHETTATDTDLALRPDGVGGVAFEAVDHSELTGVSVDDHHARYTDAEAEAAAPVQSVDGKTGAVDLSGDYEALGNSVPITRIISTTAPLTVDPADGVLDDDLTISLDIIGVPIRMDIHGIPMDAGFEMDNGRLMGYNNA
jgi:hypothetical protein